MEYWYPSQYAQWGCFNITNGLAVVPDSSSVHVMRRISLSYFPTFYTCYENPKFTVIYPLVKGYYPKDAWGTLTDNGKYRTSTKEETTITLVKYTRKQEIDNMERILISIGQPNSKVDPAPEGAACRLKIIQYALDRYEELTGKKYVYRS